MLKERRNGHSKPLCFFVAVAFFLARINLSRQRMIPTTVFYDLGVRLGRVSNQMFDFPKKFD